MKNLLLPALAAAAIGLSTPHSFAYDQNPWHDIERMVPDLNDGYDHLLTQRERWGSSPEIRDQIAELHERLHRFDGLVSQHAGDPSDVRKMGENLGRLEKRISSEFHSHIRSEEVVVPAPHHHVW